VIALNLEWRIPLFGVRIKRKSLKIIEEYSFYSCALTQIISNQTSCLPLNLNAIPSKCAEGHLSDSIEGMITVLDTPFHNIVAELRSMKSLKMFQVFVNRTYNKQHELKTFGFLKT